MLKFIKSLMLAGTASLVLTLSPALAETLRVGVWDLPPGKGNPFTGRSVPSVFVWDAVFDPLVRISATGGPEAVFAKSWKSVEPTRWRFELKEGVTFSNGAAAN